MAYLLSLQPHSPLKRSFSDNPYLQASSTVNGNLFRPLCDIATRNTSACSLYTLGSNRTADRFQGNENTPPLTSQSLLNLAPENNASPLSPRPINLISHKRNNGINQLHPFRSRITAPSDPLSRKSLDGQRTIESAIDDEISEVSGIVAENDAEEPHAFSLYDAIRIPLPQGRCSDNSGTEQSEEHEEHPHVSPVNFQPFRRWMSTLRKRHLQQKHYRVPATPSLASCDEMPHPSSLPLSSRRLSESMTSSMDYVTAMKSTSITIASTSIAPHSENGFTGSNRILQRESAFSDARRSMDSHPGHLGPILDESAWIRSLQRRKVVEELISSEESYVADLKVLINVCSYSSKSCFLNADCSTLGLLHDPHCLSHIIWPD